MKRDKFSWTSEADQIFNEVKRLLNSEPVLAIPDLEKLFEVK